MDEQLAGWDGGYLLVSSQPAGVSSSIDGRTWRPVTPSGLTTLISSAGNDRMTAGYGASAYIVGWSSNELAVWRTFNGAQWQKTPLDVAGLTHHDSLELNLNIISAPMGVLVIGSDAVTPPSFHGFYVWRSLDHGKTFGRLIRVPMKSEAPSPGYRIDAVQATPNSFLASADNDHGAIILSSADGVRWTNISSAREMAGTYIARPIDGNSSNVILFNWDAKSRQPLAMHRHGNAWYPSAVDPGHLPDAGVVPDNERTVNAVCNWGTGFIAIGNVNPAGAQFSGMVWYSADGSQWIRQPVRNNRFDAVAEFMDAAVSNGKALVIAFPAMGSDLLMWQATGTG